MENDSSRDSELITITRKELRKDESAWFMWGAVVMAMAGAMLIAATCTGICIIGHHLMK